VDPGRTIIKTVTMVHSRLTTPVCTASRPAADRGGWVFDGDGVVDQPGVAQHMQAAGGGEPEYGYHDPEDGVDNCGTAPATRKGHQCRIGAHF
jgi:hypothetical protein